jgi:hypothetical protein
VGVSLCTTDTSVSEGEALKAIDSAITRHHPWALGHNGLYEENGGSSEIFDLSTFVLDFLFIFLAAFFAAFFSMLDFLVFLAIWCVLPIVVAASWTWLCTSQGSRLSN